MKIKSAVRTRVTTITCPNCKSEIYSRSRHDFHYCNCGETAVDGGFDYLRYLAKNIQDVKQKTRYVNATRKELYDDWNTRKDLFGAIKGAKNA